MSMPGLIEGYVACRGCHLKSVAVENISCELEVGIFQVEASWFMHNWLNNAVVGGDVATRVESCICRASVQ